MRRWMHKVLDDPVFEQQLEIIAPEVVVALGKPAAQFLLNTDAPISGLRGRFQEASGHVVMPTYHPEYLLIIRR